MEITDPFRFAFLGARIRYFVGVTEGYGIHGPGLVMDNLCALSDQLKELGFTVCANLCQQTHEPIRKRLASAFPDGRMLPTSFGLGSSRLVLGSVLGEL